LDLLCLVEVSVDPFGGDTLGTLDGV